MPFFFNPFSILLQFLPKYTIKKLAAVGDVFIISLSAIAYPNLKPAMPYAFEKVCIIIRFWYLLIRSLHVALLYCTYASSNKTKELFALAFSIIFIISSLFIGVPVGLFGLHKITNFVLFVIEFKTPSVGKLRSLLYKTSLTFASISCA